VTALAVALGPRRWLLLQAGAVCGLAVLAGGLAFALLARKVGDEGSDGRRRGGAWGAPPGRTTSPPSVSAADDGAAAATPRSRGGRASAVGGAALVSANALAAAKRLGASVAASARDAVSGGGGGGAAGGRLRRTTTGAAASPAPGGGADEADPGALPLLPAAPGAGSGGRPAPDLPSAAAASDADTTTTAAIPSLSLPPFPPPRDPVAAAGIPDGEGAATWPDGSEYVGEWRGGRAHGRGVYVWPSGARYEGEWVGGLEQGVGTAIATGGGDGATGGGGGGTYTGFWLAGAMDGQGVFVPATASSAAAAASAGSAAAAAPPARAEVIFLRQYDRGNLVSETVLRVADYDVRRKAARAEAKRKAGEKDGGGGGGGGRALAPASTTHAVPRPPRPGTTIYKGHASYDLMRALQMGILFSTARGGKGGGGAGVVSRRSGAATAAARPPPPRTSTAAPLPLPTPADFSAQVEQAFPASTESGGCPAFKWKDYAPAAFARLRAAFGLDDGDYLLSLTGAGALRVLPSPGKSGSVFFLSDDDRFLVKTVSREEMRALLRLIPAYYDHVAGGGGGGGEGGGGGGEGGSGGEGGGGGERGGGGSAAGPSSSSPSPPSATPPKTLLTRFYGVHRVAFPAGGAKVRFIVMGNVFPTDVDLHRRFDIKGSTHGRTAGREAAARPGTILKDLDVDVALRPGGWGSGPSSSASTAAARAALLATLRRDTALLERLGLIDYSLLLGLHYTDWAPGEWRPPAAAGGIAGPAAPAAAPGEAGGPPEALPDSAPGSPTAAAAPRRGRAGRGGAAAARRTAFALDELIERAMASPPRPAAAAGAGGSGPGTPPPLPPPPPGLAASSSSPTTTTSGAGAPSASLPTVQSWAKLRDGTAPSSARPSSSSSSAQLSTGERGEEGEGGGGEVVSEEGVPPPPPPPPPLPPPPRPVRTTSFAAVPVLSSGLRRLASSVCLEPRLGVATPALALPAPPPSVPPNPGAGAPGHHRPTATDRVAATIAAAATASAAAATSPREVLAGAPGDAGPSSPLSSAPAPAPAAPHHQHQPRQGERVLLFFGIIDFLQSYNARKWAEHALKAAAFGPSAASVVSPSAYAARFMGAMERLFVDGEEGEGEGGGNGGVGGGS